jgi:dihydroorotate dehydrogenase (NAD+) catalytic subunit
MMNLEIQLAPCHKRGLLLQNPVVVASGTFGYGIDITKIAGVHHLGAIICKGTTLNPRSGNEEPRILKTASGMLNAVGLQNPGIHTVIAEYAQVWSTWQTPVIVNIAGETIEEFVELAALLEGIEGVAGIEVNVSCPNILAGGAVFGADAEKVAEVTSAVRRATTLPLIVKLSPNSGDVRPTALAAASSGADAVSLINTITGIGIDISRRRPTLANITGGLSGPAIKPIALRMVYEVARELRLSFPQVPVIGIGGISNANDALEFLMAGASAIQIGTIHFTNPRAGIEIVEGIEEFMQQERVKNITELVGVAL